MYMCMCCCGVRAGEMYTYSLTHSLTHLLGVQAGEMYTFGIGEYGVLGHGNDEHISRPRRIDALVGEHVTSAACGWRHTCVIACSRAHCHTLPAGRALALAAPPTQDGAACTRRHRA